MKIEKRPNGAILHSSDGDDKVLTPFQLLELSKNLKAFVLKNLDDFDEQVLRRVSFRGKEFLIVVDANLRFWEDMESGRWESSTFDVFDRYINENTTLIDIGGWIGSTSLYATQLSSRSFVFEPDPIAYSSLQRNFEINKQFDWSSKAELIPAAIAQQKGKVELGFRGDPGDSMSSVLLSHKDMSQTVDSINLAEFMNEKGLIEEEVFIKIDIEGFEYDLIPSLSELIAGLKNTRFLISLHPQFLIEQVSLQTRGGALNSSKVRSVFLKKHRALFKAFKGYTVKYSNNKPFKVRSELAKGFITGEFPRELIFERD